MNAAAEIWVTGEAAPVRVTLQDARAMAEALARALNDPGLVAASKAPRELLKDLPASVGEAEFTRSGQLRAGEWLASSTASGLRWEYQISRPAPPQVGLAFQAPLARAERGWHVPAIRFLRIR